MKQIPNIKIVLQKKNAVLVRNIKQEQQKGLVKVKE